MTFALRPAGNRVQRAGIEFSYPTKNVSFDYDARRGNLAVVEYGTGKILRQTPLRLEAGRWSRWEAVLGNRKVRLTVDGQQLTEFDLSGYGTAPWAASLVCYGPEPVDFDDVRIVRVMRPDGR